MAERLLRWTTALAGLAVVGWIGGALVDRTNPLALAVTALIGGGYVAGLLELRRFQQATCGLVRLVDADDALTGTPPRLDPWLARVPAGLRQAVRRRVEGELVGLPGPSLAPALAGLLVLLGMLGTFLGMVATLRGTGAALAGATDLPGVRDSLVAPVRGLGLAFGTSVAGIAGSAALGLLTTLCRRDRLRAGQRLDARITTSLRVFSVGHQREETLALLRRQADLMPALVDGLQALMGTLEKQAEASAARLLAGQERFHAQAADAYTGLAASVDRTLRSGLADAARQAGETVQAAAASTLDRVAGDAALLQATLGATLQAQLDGLAGRVEAGSATVAEAWALLLERQQRTAQWLGDALTASHERFATTFEQRSTTLLEAVAARLDGAVERVVDEAATALAEPARLAEGVAHGAQRTLDAATAGLAQHAEALQGTVVRTHADLLRESRRQMADAAARDHALLEERTEMLARLGAVLDGVESAATRQRSAVDALVGQAAQVLEAVGVRFERGLHVHTEAAAQVGAGAVEMASLGEAFGLAVQRFGEASERLGEHLQRIDTTLAASIARSDEQLAHHVAQAREVIDLGMLSQRQILAELQHLAAPAAPAGAHAT